MCVINEPLLLLLLLYLITIGRKFYTDPASMIK